MAVAERSVTVANRLGIHARPAAELVKIASTFASMIEISKDGQWVNAKSIMGVMTLAAEQGSVLTIRANGEDAEAAVEAVAACAGTKWEEW
jgi:phosphocarrier protein